MFDFDDGSTPAASRTETGIDLTSTQTGLSTVKDFSNLSPFAKDTKSEARSRQLTIGAIAGAGLLIAALLIWVVIKMIQTLL